MLKAIRKFFTPPVFDDAEKTQAAKLPFWILVTEGVVSGITLLIYTLLYLQGSGTIEFYYVAIALVMFVITFGLLYLLRRGHVTTAGIILVLSFMIMVDYAVLGQGISVTESAYLFPLGIIFGGLVIGGAWTLRITGLTILNLTLLYLVQGQGWSAVSPEVQASANFTNWLSNTLIYISVGGLLRAANNFIAENITNLQTTNQDLQDLSAALEGSVSERIEALSLAAEVGRRISQVPDLNSLLVEAVELIRSYYSLYYAQIYLTDHTGHSLKLRAGTGEAGKQLVARGHTLKVGPGSINGAAADQKTTIVVSDTAQSQAFLPNPLLPDTRSEMAIPLLSGDRVVGVLNLQNSVPNSLNEENKVDFEALAGQLAVAIVNAGLLTESVETRARMEAQLAGSTSVGWQEFLNAVEHGERIGFLYDNDDLKPLETPLAASTNEHVLSTPIKVKGASIGAIQIEGEEDRTWTEVEREMVEAVARQIAQQTENLRLLAQADQFRVEAEKATRRLTRDGWQEFLQDQTALGAGFIYNQTQVKPLTDEENGRQPILVKDLEVRGETIGQLAIDKGKDLDSDGAELLATVAERLSAHIENLRLLEETALREHTLEERGKELDNALTETTTLYEISEAMREANDYQELLKDAVIKMQAQGLLPGIRSASLFLIDTDQSGNPEWLNATANWIADGSVEIENQLELGSRLLVSEFPISKLWLDDPENPVFLSNVHDDERIDAEILEIYKSFGISAAAILPLTGGPDQWIGMINLTWDITHTFTTQEERILQALIPLLATATENLRLIRQTEEALTALQERTREMEASQKVTFAASERTTPEDFLDLLVNLIKDEFNFYHVQIYLTDKDKQSAVLSESTGYAGRQLLQQGHNIPLDQDALVTRCINTGEPVLAVDVSSDPFWLPNPLLPDTQSELVVPLIVNEEIIGALDIQERETGRFTKKNVPLFEAMTQQVAFLYENNELLEQISARTAEQALFAQQLSAAAEVAAELSSVLDPSQLMNEAVVLLQSRFNFYHTHIYLLDESGQNLFVEAGSGQVGLVLKERRHSIPLDREGSLVARAARERAPMLVSNTSKDSAFLPNPLLPNTRSELAIPMLVGGKLLGVLDLQDEKVSRFTETDANSLFTLAGQIATAIDNARLFGQVERSAGEIQLRYEISRKLNEADTTEEILMALSQPLIESGGCSSIFIHLDLDKAGEPEWAEVVAGWEKSSAPNLISIGTRYYLPEFPFAKVWLAESEHPQYITDINTDERLDDMSRARLVQGGTQASCYIPIQQAGQWIALLIFNWEEPHEFSQREKEMYDTLLSLAVPAITSHLLREVVNRSLEETRLRLEISQALAGNLNEEEVLDVIAEHAGIYPEAQISILLIDPQVEELTFECVRYEPFKSQIESYSVGMRFTINEFPDANQLSPDEVFIIDNMLTDERVNKASKARAQQAGAASAAMFPISIGNDWLGTLSVISKKEAYFTEEKIPLYRTLTDQGAVALRAAQLRTERQRSEERFRTLVENAPEAIILVNTDTNLFEDPNENAVLLFGMTPEELVKVGPIETSPPAQPDGRASDGVAMEYMQQAMKGERPAFDWVIINAAGAEISCEVRLVRLPGTNKLRASITDITERKAAQDAIVQSDRLKSEFLANMSHELRTPLNSIIGYTDVLLLGVDGDLNEEMRQDMEAIQDNSNHLLRLINDVLDLAKIEAGRMTFELGEVDIEDLYHETIKANAGLLINKNVQIKTEVQSGLPHIIADEIRLSQVITNLVSNAIKFTQEGTIMLRAEQEGDWVKLEVEDTGKGIEPEHLEMIFEEFTQADPSSTRTVEGTGLGLAISQRLIQMHGGEIDVTSELGKGSTFTVRLPVQAQVSPEVIVTNGDANEKLMDLLHT
jgi:PAS domain S-box-containing protein